MALHFNSVLKSLQKARSSRSRQRLANLRRNYGRTWLRCEQLESRRLLATLYVDNPSDYAITNDQGAAGLDNGDTVTWNAGAGSQHSPSTVPGLIFGTDAFGTIQDAINAAANGDDIRVGPGTFIESVNVNKSVDLLGNQVGLDAQTRVVPPTQETIVQGAGGFTAFTVTADDVTLDGFTVQGTTSGAGVFGITLVGGTSGSEVRNNIIQNNIAGISLANDSAANATVIEGNLIRNNNQPGPLSGTGIYSDEINAGGPLTNVLITNNTITGHVNPGVNLFFNSPAAQASDIEISSNIITSNANGIVLANVVSSTITRNEFFSNAGNQIVIGGGIDDLTITENFIENGGSNGIRITNFGVGPANQNILINRNSIENNAGAGISILAGQYVGTLNAESNWWGSATGPTHPNNPGGTGENITDPNLQVDFIPFLTNGTDSQPTVRGFQPSPPAPAPTTDLSVTKTDNKTTTFNGDTLTYQIVVTNTTSDAQNVTLRDVLPSEVSFVTFVAPPGWTVITTNSGGTETVTATTSVLAAGATANFVLTVLVDNGSPGDVIENTVVVSTSTNESTLANNAATDTTTIPGPPGPTPGVDISVFKDDATDPVNAGQNITYTINVTNFGDTAAANVTLTDAVPAGTTFVSFAEPAGWVSVEPAVGGTGTITSTNATLAAGATATFTLVVATSPSTANGTVVSNTASAATTSPDTAPGNNSDTETTQVIVNADLLVNKTDSPDPVIAGENITYVVGVTNLGPSDAQNVTMTDVVPPGTTFAGFISISQGIGTFAGGLITANFGTVAAGTTATLSFMVTVNPNVPDGAVINNTATATTDTPDSNLANNSDTEPTNVDAEADLSISKNDSPDPVVAGTNLEYTITVVNDGSSDAQNVTISDPIPSGTTFVSFTQTGGPAFTLTPPPGGLGAASATIATLPAGAVATFTLVVNVDSHGQQGSVTNTVNVTSTTTDPDLTDNVDTETTSVEAEADISVTKTDSPDPVAAGQNLTYTILVTNSGPSDAQNIALSDVIPADTTFVSFAAPAGWATTEPPPGGTGTVTATNSTLAAGATATFTLIVQVDPLALEGTIISNTVTVTTTTTETNPANNTDTETTDVVRPTLPECEVITFNDPGDPNSAEIVDDADSSGTNVLLVTGTNGNDVIIIEEHNSEIRVKRNGRIIGEFDEDDVDRIVVHALGGNDKVIIDWDLHIDATIFGGSGNDQLHGGAGDDEIEGDSGNDKIFGGRGNDALCGGSGNDHIYGQDGHDLISGDGGNDKLYGEHGRDVLLGGTGGDHLYGGHGDDRLYGQANNDKLYGESGNDIAVGGDGKDHVYGGSGRDLVIGGFGSDKVYGEGHDDIVIGNATQWDEDDVALMAILSEWTSSRSYNDRVENIRNGGGNNGLITLDDTTVIEDDAKDDLFGNGDRDWFFATLRDRIRDRQSGELVN